MVVLVAELVLVVVVMAKVIEALFEISWMREHVHSQQVLGVPDPLPASCSAK